MIKQLINKLMNLLKMSSETYYITGSENLLPPLDKDEEDKLVLKYNETGDLEARNALIEHNLRLVVYVAKRYDTNIKGNGTSQYCGVPFPFIYLRYISFRTISSKLSRLTTTLSSVSVSMMTGRRGMRL